MINANKGHSHTSKAFLNDHQIAPRYLLETSLFHFLPQENLLQVLNTKSKRNKDVPNQTPETMLYPKQIRQRIYCSQQGFL